MKFDGVGALVTGAASGMGRATVDALSAAGARVALLDVDAPGVEKAARESGGKALPCDMQDPAQVERAVGDAIAACGALRIVVSCAGIGRMEPIVGPRAVPFSQLAHTLRVNLLGTLQVLQLVATDLVRREPVEEGERGVMITVASGAAFDGPVESAAYTASKGGIASMTLALARELGDYGIRVNTISPGGFATAMIRNAPEELTALIPAITPFPKRMGRPPEFAELALHICSNRFLNGAVIRLDGANRMPYYSTSLPSRDGASV